MFLSSEGTAVEGAFVVIFVMSDGVSLESSSGVTISVLSSDTASMCDLVI